MCQAGIVLNKFKNTLYSDIMIRPHKENATLHIYKTIVVSQSILDAFPNQLSQTAE